MVIEFCYFFLLLIASTFSFACIGFALSLFFQKNTMIRQSVFVQLIIGISTCSILTSFLISSFQTIQIVGLLPIGYFLIQNRSKIKFTYDKTDLERFSKNLLKITYTALIVYAVAAYFFFDFQTNFYKTQHPDFHWYAKFSQGMWVSGNENTFGDSNMFFPEFVKGISPYHYFELWINGFLANTWNVSYIKTLLLLTYPLIQIACFLGIFELINFFSKGQTAIWKATFIAFGFLIISPLYFSFYEQHEILQSGKAICQISPLGFSRKYIPIYMFGILALLLYFRGYSKESIILFVCLPIISIGILPGILIGSFVYFLYQFILERKWQKLIIGFLCTLPSLIILMIYKVFTVKITGHYLNENSIFNEIVNHKFNFKLYFFTFIFPLFRVFLFCSPFFLFLAWQHYKNKFDPKKQQLIIFTGCIVLSAGFASAIAKNMPHSNQLLNNILPFLMMGISTLFITKMDFKRNWFINMLFVTLVGYNGVISYNYLTDQSIHFSDMNYNFDTTFKKKILKDLKEEESPRIGYLLPNDSNFDQTIEQHRTPLAFLAFSDSKPEVVSLNKCLNYDAYVQNYWPFYFFCKTRSKQSYLSQLNDFIITSNFCHLLIPKEKLNLLKVKYTVRSENKGYVFIDLFIKKLQSK